MDNRLLRETVLAGEITLAASRAETTIAVTDLLACAALWPHREQRRRSA
jgi:hypothetical protein